MKNARPRLGVRACVLVEFKISLYVKIVNIPFTKLQSVYDDV